MEAFLRTIGSVIRVTGRGKAFGYALFVYYYFGAKLSE
jgi:hypothetical protein